MIIYSIGVNRICDGLTLCSHDEIKYNDSKLTEARKHRDEITRSLSVFEHSRNSLYLTNSKYSIHWIISKQLNHHDVHHKEDAMHGSSSAGSQQNKASWTYTTPSKNSCVQVGAGILPARSTYVVIALGEHIKRHKCEESIFKALDKIDRDFDSKFSSQKVLMANELYQYNDFMGTLSKMKSRFQNPHSRIRKDDHGFNSTLLTNPINTVREDFVIRLQKINLHKMNKMSQKKTSNPIMTAHHAIPQGSNEHNLKSSYDEKASSLVFGSDNLSHIDETSSWANGGARSTITSLSNHHSTFAADSAIGSSITESSAYTNTLTDYNTRILRRKCRLSKFQSSNQASNFNYFDDPYSEIEFKEPINIWGYISLTLIFPCIALNFSRLWHIVTHVGHDGHYMEDLEHIFEFAMSALLCILQVKLILVPNDCLQATFGRGKTNFFGLMLLIIFQILLAEHRKRLVTLFHSAVAIYSSGNIMICRGVKKRIKTCRDMA